MASIQNLHKYTYTQVLCLLILICETYPQQERSRISITKYINHTPIKFSLNGFQTSNQK